MLLRSELSSPPKLTLSSVTISSTDLLLEEHKGFFLSQSSDYGSRRECAVTGLYSLSFLPHCHSMDEIVIYHSCLNFICNYYYWSCSSCCPLSPHQNSHALLHAYINLIILLSPRWFPSIFVLNFNFLVLPVHSELVYIGLIASLPTGVNTFASFCVSSDSCAVIVFNLCHLWLPMCITSVAQ